MSLTPVRSMTTSLRNKTILVTRQEEQSREFVTAIEQRGGRALLFPMIRIMDPDSWVACDAAIERLDSYTGLIFTSVNAVHYFLSRYVAKGMTVGSLRGKDSVAVGSQTKRALEEMGISVQFVPENYTSTSLMEFFNQERVTGKRFLFPRGSLAKDDIVTHIAQCGGVAEPVTVYRTIAPDRTSIETLHRHLTNCEIDVVTFASPSAAANFASAIGAEIIVRMKTLTAVAAIGPSTAKALSDLGMAPDIVAAESTVHGLVDAICAYFD